MYVKSATINEENLLLIGSSHGDREWEVVPECLDTVQLREISLGTSLHVRNSNFHHLLLSVQFHQSIKLSSVAATENNPIDRYYDEYSLLSDSPTDKPLIQAFRSLQLVNPPRHYIFDRALRDSPLLGPAMLHLAGLSGRLREFQFMADRIMRNAYRGNPGAFHYTLLLRGIFEGSTMWLEMAMDLARRKKSKIGYALTRLFQHLIDPDDTMGEEDEEALKILEEKPAYADLYSRFLSMKEGIDEVYMLRIAEIEEESSPYSVLLGSDLIGAIQDVDMLPKATLWYAFMIGGRVNSIWASFGEKNRGLYMGVEKLRKNAYFMEALLLFVFFALEGNIPPEAKEYLEEKGEKARYIYQYLDIMLRKSDRWMEGGNLDLLEEEFPFIPDALYFTNLPILHYLNDVHHLPRWVSRLLSKRLGRPQRDIAFERCPYCGSTNIIKFGKVEGVQRYRCRDCGRTFLGNSYYRILSHRRMYEILRENLRKVMGLSISLQLMNMAPAMRGEDFITIDPLKKVNISALLKHTENVIGSRIDRNTFYRTVKGLYLLQDFLECIERGITVKYVRFKDIEDFPERKITVVGVQMIVQEGEEKVKSVLNECTKLSGAEEIDEEEEKIMPLLEITSISDKRTFLYPDDEGIYEIFRMVRIRTRKKKKKSKERRRKKEAS